MKSRYKLPPKVLAELRAEAIKRGLLTLRTRVRTNEYCHWGATPAQKACIDAWVLNKLFGGAVGGGKSAAIVISCLAKVGTPGYSALCLKETFAEMAFAGGLLDKFEENLRHTDAHWDADDKTYYFPSGAQINFSGIANDRDQRKLQGPEWVDIYVDEAGNVKSKYLGWLPNRIRVLAKVECPSVYMLTANPGGPSHDWLKEMFVDSSDPDWQYFPSRLVDNPYLKHDDYLKRLSGLDATVRDQLVNGDWDVLTPGLFLSEKDLPECSPWDVPAMDCYVRGFDPSLTGLFDSTGRVLTTVDGQTQYVLHAKATKETIIDLPDLVQRQILADPPGTILAMEGSAFGNTVVQHLAKYDKGGGVIQGGLEDAVEVWMEAQARVAMGKPPHAAVVFVPQVGSKAQRASLFMARAKQGLVKLRRGDWVKPYVSQFVRFRAEKSDSDDLIDATSIATAVVARLSPARLGEHGEEQAFDWEDF